MHLYPSSRELSYSISTSSISVLSRLLLLTVINVINSNLHGDLYCQLKYNMNSNCFPLSLFMHTHKPVLHRFRIELPTFQEGSDIYSGQLVANNFVSLLHSWMKPWLIAHFSQFDSPLRVNVYICQVCMPTLFTYLEHRGRRAAVSAGYICSLSLLRDQGRGFPQMCGEDEL